MAHSYVEFQTKGFYLNDSDLVVFSRLLIEQSSSVSIYISSLVVDLFVWWEDALNNSGPGAIDLRLDDFLVDSISKETFCVILHDTRLKLRDLGAILSADSLNTIAKSGAIFVGDRKTSDFETIASRFSVLIGCEQPGGIVQESKRC